MDLLATGSISLFISIFALAVSIVTTRYAHQANRTKGFLKISVEFVAEDVYGESEMTVEELVGDVNALLDTSSQVIGRRHSFRFDIRNTGRQPDQILKVGYVLNNRERKEFRLGNRQRLPLTVESGQLTQLFWVLHWEEYEQFERMREIWFETVHETVRAKVRS